MSKKLFENLQNRTYCVLCDREITNHTHISCAECENMILCVVCFSTGQESKSHKFHHRYSVISRIDLPLYAATWTMHDELLLIEALEKFGYGNWTEIARYVKHTSEEEVEEHFLTFYLNQQLENTNTNKTQLNGFYTNECIRNGNEFQAGMIQETFQNLSERIRLMLAPSFKLAKEKSERYGINLTDKTGYGQVIGYMPLRQEFEVEYNNDAELYIADMEFSSDDSELEKKTKLCILEIYHSRIQERDEKKRFVIEHDLIDINEVLNRERKMTHEERSIRNATRDKMPFLTKDEYEELVKCYLNEIHFDKFQNDFAELQKYNINNLQSFEDLIFNETLRKQNAEEFFSSIKTVEKDIETNKSKKRTKAKANLFVNTKTCTEKALVETPEISGLLKDELEFCTTHQLNFDFYLIVKEYLIRECYFRGSIRKEEFLKVCNSNLPQLELVFDFMVTQKLLLQDQD